MSQFISSLNILFVITICDMPYEEVYLQRLKEDLELEEPKILKNN